MTKLEFDERKRELCQNIETTLAQIKYDIRIGCNKNDAIENIISDAEYNVDMFERMIEELNATVNSLEELKDELEDIEEE